MDGLQYLSEVSDAESFRSSENLRSRSKSKKKIKSSSKHIKSEHIDYESDMTNFHENKKFKTRSKIEDSYNKDDSRARSKHMEYEKYSETQHRRKHKRRRLSHSPTLDSEILENSIKSQKNIHKLEVKEENHHRSNSKSNKRHKSHHKKKKSRHHDSEMDTSVDYKRKSKRRHHSGSSSSSSSNEGAKFSRVKEERMSPSTNGVDSPSRVPDISRWEDSTSNSRSSSRRPQTASNAVKRETLSGSDTEDRRGESNWRGSATNGNLQQNNREQWGRPSAVKEEVEPIEKAKPNLGLSGKLAEDTNTYKGVVIKYSQPPEARKPKRRWRWYIFKGDEELPFLPLHRQSAYLIGRERRVVDVPTDHPSCSKQHAVLQYRLVRYTRDDGTVGRTVKPYIIDLDSANGTYVNNRRITTRSYVELMEKDVVKFGYSSREYVLLHETSKDSDADTADAGLDMSPVSALMNM
ncbi:smad nuclear-interacting protein 1 [Hyalella azteca]|uniref:Smad nuclear-interacting protein 1 n=1 Tax=Hyalella azteca TaxID=294128 RepID=A0A8B7P2B5_HYAAZ|nr:smad nuclear-interacting protein 1 [Hyalella azteca]